MVQYGEQSPDPAGAVGSRCRIDLDAGDLEARAPLGALRDVDLPAVCGDDRGDGRQPHPRPVVVGRVPRIEHLLAASFRNPGPVVGDVEATVERADGDRHPVVAVLGRVTHEVLEQLREPAPVGAAPTLGLVVEDGAVRPDAVPARLDHPGEVDDLGRADVLRDGQPGGHLALGAGNRGRPELVNPVGVGELGPRFSARERPLQGGLIPERSYMLRGRAGSGKTILGLHFLEAGIENGETALFVNLEEDLEDLQANAAALGFDTDGMGVTTILVDETRNITGEFDATQDNISYLADNIVFLRHLELRGELRKALGVLKKRTSDFERTVREFEITDEGIMVGDPLTRMRGILSGTPELIDEE